MNIEVLMGKVQRGAAAYIKECFKSSSLENLNNFLDYLLDPYKSIEDSDTIEWLRWLMAGGSTPDEFSSSVRLYDNATTCGLVWGADFVAYRCRTCGISPCMSLCADCFQRGNHTGHDFNMFLSQAGGACDCGDTAVMREDGFCNLHESQASQSSRLSDHSLLRDLLCVANAIMPRLILRLIQHMRKNSGDLDQFLAGIIKADKFITMLHEMSSMGTAMREVMAMALTNPETYTRLIEVDEGNCTPEYYNYMQKCKSHYEAAVASWTNVEPPKEYKDILSLQNILVHKSFLDELVFWSSRYEFPQKLVFLLLNLLPDADYKASFTRAFVLHYSRISKLLVVSNDPKALSDRVVHVSVQLFSNESLALRMAEQMSLLHVILISLKCMMANITKPRSQSSKTRCGYEVVDCNDPVMKNHCYWPLVSDLNNILSHQSVAIKFLEDDGLLEMWFGFLAMFQGMNLNIRELNQHVELETNSYYAAFSAELEASASPMWTLISHMKDSSTAHLTKNVLRHCRSQLNRWLESVNVDAIQSDMMQVSFHLPLHRYFSIFLYQGVRNQGLSLAELLPPPNELRALVFHPLRVQSGFYESMSGLWAWNGLQIRGQSMIYIQNHFCNSMVDADLFLLQVAMMNLPHGEFLNMVLERFHVLESLNISDSGTNRFLEPDQKVLMIDNFLIFLATLASVRTLIGMGETDVLQLEMITLLCKGDKTRNDLKDLTPERIGNSSQSKVFKLVLSKIADYRTPDGNTLDEVYVPNPYVWENLYDPIYTQLRAVYRSDFQNSLDRFAEYTKQTGKFKEPETLWPPYRIPPLAAEPYTDPRRILLSRVLHGVLFAIFYKAVHTEQLYDVQVVNLAVYLLEMALSVCDSKDNQVTRPHEENNARIDSKFATWYSSDCLLVNLRTEVDSVPEGIVPPRVNETQQQLRNILASFTSSVSIQREELVEQSYSVANKTAVKLKVNDSIISLLLKLHSKLSSCQDSYVPFWETPEARKLIEDTKAGIDTGLKFKIIRLTEEAPSSSLRYSSSAAATGTIHPSVEFSYSELYCLLQPNAEDSASSRIGDGPFFVGKILDQIAAKDDACRATLISTRDRLRKVSGAELQAKEKQVNEEKRRKVYEKIFELLAQADFAEEQKCMDNLEEDGQGE